MVWKQTRQCLKTCAVQSIYHTRDTEKRKEKHIEQVKKANRTNYRHAFIAFLTNGKY